NPLRETRSFIKLRQANTGTDSFPQLLSHGASKKKGANRISFVPFTAKSVKILVLALSLPDRLHVSVEPLLRIFQKQLVSNGNGFSTLGKSSLDGRLGLKVISGGLPAH